jgi:UDP-2-acetamido-3-amino-2,3-dideoxy-glucuronate N-acetyltransferase
MELNIINSKFGKNPKIWNYVNIYNSTFGDDVSIGAFSEIGGSKIGNNCRFQAYSFIPPGYVIEDDVFWGPGARGANDPKLDGKLIGSTIKKGAKIGMGALIIGGITIGKNAKIGMGAIVIHDVPDNATVVGNPAHRI